jgi:DNA polymerase-1
MNLSTASELLHKGTLALARAERQGIRVDMDVANANYAQLTESIDSLTLQFKATKLYKHWEHVAGKGGINFESNEQLAHFLYKIKKLKPAKSTATGKGAVDEEALKALGIPELDTLLQIRKFRKLRDTYLMNFISESADGFIHPVFNLHTVSTYRSSSDSPNFQNIPTRDEEAKKIVRSCLFPRKGHRLLEIDFSGIEVCIAACYHKDPTMITYIKDPTTDMHGDMAKQIFIIDEFSKKIPAHKHLRGAAKNGFVFPQFYGDYYKNNAVSLSDWASLPVSGKYRPDMGIEMPDGSKLGEHLIQNNIKTADHFVEHLQEIEQHFWGVRFPVYDAWKKKWFKQYQQRGYVEFKTGFRCYGIMNRKEVINWPVQGSAFHCLLWCFIRIDEIMREEKWQTRLIGQIHDSMVFDVYPPELDHVLKTVKHITEVELLEHWKWIIVPMTIEAELCEVDESWYHKKEIKI